MIFGYARAFAHDSDLEGQMKRLESLGVASKSVFCDTKPSRDCLGTQLKVVLTSLSKGDVLVVDRLACLARTYSSLLSTLNDLGLRGINLVSLQEGIDTREADAKFFFKSAAIFEQFLQELHLENTAFGKKAAKGKGSPGGRPKKISETQADEIRKLIRQGEAIGVVARQFKVERTTVWRLINQTSSSS